MTFDIEAIRRQFPFLRTESQDIRTPVYLDNAATAQKPQVVIDRMRTWEEHAIGNVRRGVHPLTEHATLQYESARETVANYIGAASPKEIVFTRNATEGINLVARSFGSTLGEGDTVVLSILEHHSNIVPWMQLASERGVALRWVHCKEDGDLDMEEYQKYLDEGRVKLVAMTGQSNVLGVRPSLENIIRLAHKANAFVLVDASQLIVHAPIDVQRLQCEFLVFSGHKLYGPTGIGALYIKKEVMATMPPFLGGGGMVWNVTEEDFTPSDPPERFEAGTPPLTQALGLATAMDWLGKMSPGEHEAHEQILLQKAVLALREIEAVHVLGPKNPEHIFGCVSFTVEGLHPHDITDILGQRGVTLRAGNHCAAPLHAHLGVPATTRISVGVYTSLEDIERCITELQHAISFLNGR